MRITDLLSKESIERNAHPVDKKDALEQAIALMEKSGRLRDTASYRRSVWKREEEGSTGIGGGIAIPHGKDEGVRRSGLAAMVIPNGVSFDSLDEEPVYLLFLIAAEANKNDLHLEVLSRLSTMLMEESFIDRLLEARSDEEFLQIIDETEQSRLENEVDPVKPLLAAVTSCPTGIAHTYMAAESLQKAAARNGCEIRIETRGSAGVKQALTKEEIQRARAVIIAADAKVPMERFDGKHVITCPVSDGIRNADALVQMALAQEASVYRADKNAKGAKEALDSNRNTKQIGHRVYSQLMNGVSHMLPFVVGGGILIALAFLVDGLLLDMDTLSLQERELFGSITKWAALLKEIGDVAFSFMLPVLAGFIASAIGDRPALAPGFVGGMIAYQGKSGFFGALAAGFLAGYLIVLLRYMCKGLPDALEKTTPVLIYPLLGIFLVGLGMYFVIEPIMGFVNEALNSGLARMGNVSRVLLGLVLGGMMAVDMGGPCNKAAYVFGTAAIASGNYDIMAAVMVGGMTPPCAIALATILFPGKFTREERRMGPTNFIMGLAFITEGAIPYAAADPMRVIPSCIIGSAAAGACSMLFGCTLMAPHGGIFVFPVVGAAWWYLLALLIGTVVSTVFLGILKEGKETTHAGDSV